MKKSSMVRAFLLMAGLLLIVGAAAPSAYANCEYSTKTVTTFYGFDNGDGTTMCYVVIGPTPPIIVVGERTVWCDGSETSWGHTDCTLNSTTYESCPPICD